MCVGEHSQKWFSTIGQRLRLEIYKSYELNIVSSENFHEKDFQTAIEKHIDDVWNTFLHKYMEKFRILSCTADLCIYSEETGTSVMICNLQVCFF